jgi:hypothetical protein
MRRGLDQLFLAQGERLVRVPAGCTNTIPLQIDLFESATEFVHPTGLDLADTQYEKRRYS